jgi:hypothetical protein
MRAFKLLSLVLLLSACAGPGVGASVGSEAVKVTVEPDVARTSAWLAELERDPSAVGPGELEVLDLSGAPQLLELAALRVDVEPAGAMARYEVEHVFFNPTEQQLEGTFRFPLPSGSIVTGLALEIDGKLMDGEMLERERAREIYEEIVDNMRDPALLEWEAGQTFKLRVFPIQPGERKRVVMRYMAPLRPDEQAESGFAIEIPSAVPAMQTVIPSLVVRLDGVEVMSLRDHAAHENLTIGLDAAHVPAFVEEVHDGQRYLSARIDLDWSKVPEPSPVSAMAEARTVFIVDSSRSALESWPLAREAVGALLDSLGEDESFLLMASDLDVQVFGDGFVRNDASTRAAALAFLAAIEPDGASDLGRAITRVDAALRDVGRVDQIIYVGDGTPTWGTTDRKALVEQAEAGLRGAPLHALSVGKRESRDVLEALTGATGGRTVAPKSLAQIAAFSQFLERAPQARRLSAVTVELPGVDQLHAPQSTTWFEGERPVVHLRLTKDGAIPSEVIVHGRIDGQPFTQSIPLGEPEAMIGVRQQWVARELATLTDKPAIVELSVAHSVLAKHTALLVLESEEAYERYAIERRNGPEQESDPAISGRNLDGDANPYLGPGDLQPGDPEIHIPAPRDAVSVEVVFPFGESKAARWEEPLGQWTVRFLVDDDTPPGTYAVLVRVTHADGRVEMLELEYRIDIEAPQLRLELRARDDGAYDVYAHQVLSEADAARERIEGLRGEEQAATLDASRVELIMPDGQTINLRQGLAGTFVRRWEPQGAVTWPAMVTVVVGDRALNNRRIELPLEGPR